MRLTLPTPMAEDSSREELRDCRTWMSGRRGLWSLVTL